MTEEDSEYEEEYDQIVIDNGSGFIKAGFTYRNIADIEIFPPVFGTWRGRIPTKYQQVIAKYCSRPAKTTLFADQALSERHGLHLKYPIDRGIVCDWDAMKKIWHYTFYNELRIQPEECSILMTESPLNHRQNRERMCKILFETFNVPSFYVAIQSVLALYASGLLTGLVIDSGHSVTHTVPVYEGYALKYGVCTLNIGGRDLNNFMNEMISERGYSNVCTYIQRRSERLRKRNIYDIEVRFIPEMIKEKLSYVAKDFDCEMKNYAEISNECEKDYELPDGKIIRLGNERFRCPEVLFKPYLIGDKSDGLPMMVNKSVCYCNNELKKDLLGNVVLSGGNTMFEGIGNRLYNELVKIVLCKNIVDGYMRKYSVNRMYNDIIDVTYDYCGIDQISKKYAGFHKVNIVESSERKYSVWIGGSILASLTDFQQNFITKNEYDETGPHIVHRKCF